MSQRKNRFQKKAIAFTGRGINGQLASRIESAKCCGHSPLIRAASVQRQETLRAIKIAEVFEGGSPMMEVEGRWKWRHMAAGL